MLHRTVTFDDTLEVLLRLKEGEGGREGGGGGLDEWGSFRVRLGEEGRKGGGEGGGGEETEWWRKCKSRRRGRREGGRRRREGGRRWRRKGIEQRWQ